MTVPLLALLLGQSSVPAEPRLHAIVGARVEVGDGRVLERATLVIRDGTIVALGPDAAVPPGAQVLDGRGLTLVPGFIDSWTDKGTTTPAAAAAANDGDAAPPRVEYASAAMREANRKGVRPELQARSILSLDGIAGAYRSAGFTTAMVVPPGGYLAGVGTLVSLSGRPAREAVVVPQTAMSLRFDGDAAGDAYPSSLLGRIAQVRQAFEDARGLRATATAYGAGGTQRPPSDPALEALVSVLDGALPVAIEADTPAQIDRALLVAGDYGLKPILVGGLQAYRRLDRLKGVPLILGLNFGEEPKLDPAKPAEVTFDDTPPDSPETRAERVRTYNEAARNAVALQAAGIPFALSTHGCKDVAEFMARLRAAVRNGLPRAVAVRALTLDAARLLGVSRTMGTLEVGKAANVAAWTGDFMDEKSKVRMVYVDGRRIDPEAKPTPPAPSRSGGLEDQP